jgi:hypothetical protein
MNAEPMSPWSAEKPPDPPPETDNDSKGGLNEPVKPPKKD